MPSSTREGDLLEDFATYCALDEHLHRRNPDLWLWTRLAGRRIRTRARRQTRGLPQETLAVA